MTKQRQIILDVLKNTRWHPTADEVFQRIRCQLPKISLGTVYRNLDVLLRLAMISKLMGHDGQSRYDGTVSKHYHVHCIRCGRVDDATEVPSLDLDEKNLNICGYKIHEHKLEFFGVCPDCRGPKESVSTSRITEKLFSKEEGK